MKLERRHWIRRTLFLLVLTMGWFFWTANHDADRRQIFQLWRNGEFLIGCVLAYCSVVAAGRVWSRHVQFWLLYAGVLVAFMLILLEGIGALGLVSYKILVGAPDSDPLGKKPIAYQDLRGRTYQDISYLWGADSELIPFHFKTDRYGFRNHADRESADVYFVGDSILVAALLSAEETVSSRLEHTLRRPVMNVALTAIGLEAERDIFRTAGFPLENSLVIQFVFEGNDLGDSMAYGLPEAAWSMEDLFLWNALMRLQQLTQPAHPHLNKYSGTIGGQEFLFACIHGVIHAELDGIDREVEPLTQALLDMNEYVTGAGGQYGVVYIPAKLRVLGPFCHWPEQSELIEYEKLLSPLRDVLVRWAQSNGIDVLDTTDAFIAIADRGEIPWFTGDTHPNAIGHRALADVVANWELVHEWNSATRPPSGR